MKFTKIFNETVGLFPEKIALEGGKLIGEEGGYFPELRTAWNSAEKRQKN